MDQQVELLEFQNEVLRVMLATASQERDQLAQHARRLAKQNRRLLTVVQSMRTASRFWRKQANNYSIMSN
jgi:hypothetical protein